jgi:hypothetical protein
VRIFGRGRPRPRRDDRRVAHADRRSCWNGLGMRRPPGKVYLVHGGPEQPGAGGRASGGQCEVARMRRYSSRNGGRGRASVTRCSPTTSQHRLEVAGRARAAERRWCAEWRRRHFSTGRRRGRCWSGRRPSHAAATRAAFTLRAVSVAPRHGRAVRDLPRSRAVSMNDAHAAGRSWRLARGPGGAGGADRLLSGLRHLRSKSARPPPSDQKPQSARSRALRRAARSRRTRRGGGRLSFGAPTHVWQPTRH